MRKFPEQLTDRLRLRDFAEEDLEIFASYRADPVIAEFQSWESHTLSMARDFFDKQYALEFGQPGSWYQIAVADRGSNEMLGDCVLHFDADEDQRQVEIGFTLARQNQQKGYAAEAVAALLRFAFEELHVHRVTACVDARNDRSCRLLQKLNFRREGHLVESCWCKGKWDSLFLFALLDREFHRRGDGNSRGDVSGADAT